MGDIYQEIWNADQEGNGIEPLLHHEEGDPVRGFVKVNAEMVTSKDRDLRLLPEAVIPEAKTSTYELCKNLFDNYNLPEPELEVDTADERQEVHDLVEAMVKTPPMQVARAYVARETGAQVSEERWHNTLIEMWFRKFSSGGDPALSGFEHVVVGEQEKSKVQGYHFWYKYFLDDGFAREVDGSFERFPGLEDDRIEYLGSKQKEGQILFPESVTISYRWLAPDFDDRAVRPLSKKIGGFFVGCSVEGLLALGTVRAHLGVRAPKVAAIEGARYDMRVFRDPSGRHVRTFYPVFLGAADPSDGAGRPGGTGASGGGASQGGTISLEPHVPVATHPGPVRIIAALVNPAGHDPSRETVTLVNTGPEAVPITNWQLIDRNGKRSTFAETVLQAGAFHTEVLTGADVQLSNKGGEIILVDDAGRDVHKVVYARAQVKAQGQTILF